MRKEGSTPELARADASQTHSALVRLFPVIGPHFMQKSVRLSENLAGKKKRWQLQECVGE